MQLSEKTLHTQRIYEGRIISLRVDKAALPDGGEAIREVVDHSGGVGVLALDGDDVLLVRQFRYAIGRESLEIPAGKREKGEEPAVCGRRELEEETGHVAGRFEAFGQLEPTPAYCTEVIHLFLAGDLQPTAQKLDADEFLHVERVSFDLAVAMCMDGRITDAKTVIAILKYKAMRDSRR